MFNNSIKEKTSCLKQEVSEEKNQIRKAIFRTAFRPRLARKGQGSFEVTPLLKIASSSLSTCSFRFYIRTIPTAQTTAKKIPAMIKIV